ncbi:MAG: hypothetical protein KAJ13_09865 [Gemmatimonadetes bacterium]|nr:hypothetical protein [Gemmatimonadota bacterium]
MTDRIVVPAAVWDYVPSGMDRITGHEFDDYAKLVVEGGPERRLRQIMKDHK